MKYILFISFLFLSFLGAQETEKKVSDEKISELIEVKDTSGLSETEVRKKADNETKVSIFQTPWEEVSPN